MPKFYVCSRDLYVTVMADSPVQAAQKAINQFDPEKEKIGGIMYVSQTGYNSKRDPDHLLLDPFTLSKVNRDDDRGSAGRPVKK